MRIVSITSSRADVGILRPVWKALASSGADLHIIATGMHRAIGASPVDLDGIRATLHEAGRDLGGRADAVASSAMADITAACGALYATLKPDLLLVMGDRLDMLPAAVASLPFNLPLAHLHGGEVTEGAIDDRARHAMTKLAHLHLVSCESAAQRIRDMGEESGRIVVTGAPGLDTLLEAPVLDRDEFLAETGLNNISGVRDAFILATVHPETNSSDPQVPLDAVLGALDDVKLPVLFTAPNSDPGGAEMKTTLLSWIVARPFAHFVDTLGSRLYPNALRHAVVMVGNSSSGIIEAGLFGLPVVDVGGRQKGRERARSVLHAALDPAAVHASLTAAIAKAARAPSTLYGDGWSGPRVARAIVEFLALTTSAQKHKYVH